MVPVIPIKHCLVDEEARLEIARIDTSFSDLKAHVSSEIASLRSDIEDDRKIRARTTTKRLVFWGTIISALVVTCGAISSAWITSHATSAARDQGGEVARQALGAELERREGALLERALAAQHETEVAERKAWERMHPVPLGAGY
jgi:hypothetical protein